MRLFITRIKFAFKHDCYLLSSFILFNKFSINSQITTRFRENFKLSKVMKEIHNLRFQSIDERTSNYLERGGKYEDFFVQGEEIYTYSFSEKMGLTPSFIYFPSNFSNRTYCDWVDRELTMYVTKIRQGKSYGKFTITYRK